MSVEERWWLLRVRGGAVSVGRSLLGSSNKRCLVGVEVWRWTLVNPSTPLMAVAGRACRRSTPLARANCEAAGEAPTRRNLFTAPTQPTRKQLETGGVQTCLAHSTGMWSPFSLLLVCRVGPP